MKLVSKLSQENGLAIHHVNGHQDDWGIRMTKEKLQKIFEVAPWLKDSKNVIHMPIIGIDKDKESVSWRELYQLVFKEWASSKEL